MNVSGGNVSGGNTVTVHVGGGKTPPPVPPPPRLNQTDSPSSGSGLPAIPSATGVSSAGPTITHTSSIQNPLPVLPAVNSDGQSSSQPVVRPRKNIGNGSAILVVGGESPTEITGSQNGAPVSTPNGPAVPTRTTPPTPAATPVTPQPNSQVTSPALATSSVVNGQLPTKAVSSASSSPVPRSTPPSVAPRATGRHHRTHKNKRNSGWLSLANVFTGCLK